MTNMIHFLIDIFAAPATQEPAGTLGFFEWYFYGLSGLGGWLIFLLLGLVALIWLMYNSGSRRLPATGWRIGVVVLTFLILPTIIYRFTVTTTHFDIYNILKVYEEEECPEDVLRQMFPDVSFTDCVELSRRLPPLTPFGEYVFYLGLLGGILAPVLAVGYWVTFQGLVGCPQGHVYEQQLGECPDCNRLRRASIPQPLPPAYQGAAPQTAATPPPRPVISRKPKVSDAWLLDISNNRRYDLCQGITTVGRADDNDIVVKDPAMSRRHAQIREAHGHFTLSDVGAKTGIRLNDRKLRNPQVMQNGDMITLGDTVLKFITSE
jgi:hypothetical protein